MRVIISQSKRRITVCKRIIIEYVCILRACSLYCKLTLVTLYRASATEPFTIRVKPVPLWPQNRADDLTGLSLGIWHVSSVFRIPFNIERLKKVC